jgi:D-alanyl-D-alanine carboxypeptidase
MMIEKVTGKSAGDEITQRTIDRLGLKNTEFATGPQMTGSYSHGYWSDPETGKLADITRINPSMAWTAGCMVSNLADLETWVKALLDGKLVSQEALKEQMTFVDTGMPFVKYGLGVFEVNGYVGNGGAIPGFNSAMFRHPDRKDTVVSMFNKDPVDSGKAVAMTDALFALTGAMASEK